MNMDNMPSTVKIKISNTGHIASVDEGNWTDKMSSPLYIDYSAQFECVTDGYILIGRVRREFCSREIAMGGDRIVEVPVESYRHTNKFMVYTAMGMRIIRDN
jgi:hypothetical protein